MASATCAVRHVCLPTGLLAADIEQLERMVSVRRKVARHTGLFRPGDAFEAIDLVRTGFFKTSTAAEDGRVRVLKPRRLLQLVRRAAETRQEDESGA